MSTLDRGTQQDVGTGRESDIAIDSNGKVHISYYSDCEDAVRYITNASGNWVNIIIENNMPVLSSTSLFIDKNNKVHIAYDNLVYSGNPSVYHLKYATNASGSWKIETVDFGAGAYNSIAIDNNGNVHLSYPSFDRHLQYLTNKTGSWVREAVSAPWEEASHTKIGIDSKGNVHIVYMEYISKALRYATNSGLLPSPECSGNWCRLAVDLYSGWDNDMLIDANDVIHISHYTETPIFALKYSTITAGNAQTEIVTNGVCWFTTIGMDSRGKIHIVFFDLGDYSLKRITNAWPHLGPWVIELIDDSRTDTGRYTSMAIDKNDHLHVSYAAFDWRWNGIINVPDYNLMYAYK